MKKYISTLLVFLLLLNIAQPSFAQNVQADVQTKAIVTCFNDQLFPQLGSFVQSEMGENFFTDRTIRLEYLRKISAFINHDFYGSFFFVGGIFSSVASAIYIIVTLLDRDGIKVWRESQLLAWYQELPEYHKALADSKPKVVELKAKIKALRTQMAEAVTKEQADEYMKLHKELQAARVPYDKARTDIRNVDSFKAKHVVTDKEYAKLLQSAKRSKIRKATIGFLILSVGITVLVFLATEPEDFELSQSNTPLDQAETEEQFYASLSNPTPEMEKTRTNLLQFCQEFSKGDVGLVAQILKNMSDEYITNLATQPIDLDLLQLPFKD